jgi:hypothetical protein
MKKQFLTCDQWLKSLRMHDMLVGNDWETEMLTIHAPWTIGSSILISGTRQRQSSSWWSPSPWLWLLLLLLRQIPKIVGSAQKPGVGMIISEELTCNQMLMN